MGTFFVLFLIFTGAVAAVFVMVKEKKNHKNKACTGDCSACIRICEKET